MADEYTFFMEQYRYNAVISGFGEDQEEAAYDGIYYPTNYNYYKVLDQDDNQTIVEILGDGSPEAGLGVYVSGNDVYVAMQRVGTAAYNVEASIDWEHYESWGEDATCAWSINRWYVQVNQDPELALCEMGDFMSFSGTGETGRLIFDMPVTINGYLYLGTFAGITDCRYMDLNFDSIIGRFGDAPEDQYHFSITLYLRDGPHVTFVLSEYPTGVFSDLESHRYFIEYNPGGDKTVDLTLYALSDGTYITSDRNAISSVIAIFDGTEADSNVGLYFKWNYINFRRA